MNVGTIGPDEKDPFKIVNIVRQIVNKLALISVFIETLLDDADAATARTTLGVTANGSAAVGQLPGTSTNDNAASGKVGEYVEGVLLFASRVTLTSGVAKTITNISLTAGDWDVSGVAQIFPAITTNLRATFGSIHTTTDTLDPVFEGNSGIDFGTAGSVSDASFQTSAPVTRKRYSLASTTTVYLVARANFSVSTAEAYGKITARRVR